MPTLGLSTPSSELISSRDSFIETQIAEAHFQKTAPECVRILEEMWAAKINSPTQLDNLGAEVIAVPNFLGYLRHYSPQLLASAITRFADYRETVSNPDAYFKTIVHDFRRKELKKAAR